MQIPKASYILSHPLKPSLGVFAFFLLLYALFGNRPANIEEAPLLNLPYMFAEYHQATYPIYGDWEMAIAHPPTNGIMLGFAMKVLPLFYAVAFWQMIFLGLIFWGIQKLKIPTAFRLAFAAAIWCWMLAAFQTEVHFSIRPDVTWVLCWLAAVILLEVSRSQDWKMSYLAGGTFLYVLAVSYHYVAFPAIFGIFVYAVAIKWDTSWLEWLKRLGIMALSGCLIGLPFLLFFWFAENEAIMAYLLQDQEMAAAEFASETKWALLQRHISYYQQLSLNKLSLFLNGPIWLIAQSKLPIGIVSILGLSFFRHSRRIALAALPQILFFTFFSQVKKDYYIYPSWLMAALLGFVLVAWIWQKSPQKQLKSQSRTFVLMALFAWGILSGFSLFFHDKIHFRGIYKRHPLDVMRACSQKMIGSDAWAFGPHSAWYISGGEYWFNSDIKAYYAADVLSFPEKVDALFDYSFGEYGELGTAYVPENVASVSDTYFDESTQWSGTVFSPRLNYALYHPIPSLPLPNDSAQKPKAHCFYVDHTNVSVWEAAKEGTDYIGIAILQKEISYQEIPQEYQHVFLIRPIIHNDQQMLHFIISKEQEASFRTLIQQYQGKIREIYPAQKQELSHKQFIRSVPSFHTHIEFHQNLNELER